MQTFIKTDVEYSSNANIPQQAIFFAQKHFNNNGHPERIVISAEFVDGGIMVEYDGPKETDDIQDLSDQEKTAFDEAVTETVGESDGEIVLDDGEVVETIGPNDMNLENIDREPEKLVCPKCGKEYKNKGRGPDFYEAHIEKCEG